MIKGILAAGLMLTVSTTSALAATQVTWWHAMGGELGTKLEEIVAGYNASQNAYEVVPVYKGSYAETMTGAIAAFRAGEQPAIVQVFEVGTGTMMAAKGAVYPVYEADGRIPALRVRSRRTTCRQWSAITRTPTATCCPCRSTRRRRSSITTRTSSRRPGSTPNTPPKDLGGRGSLLRKKIMDSRRGQVRLHQRLDLLGAAGELLGLAQPADRHATRTASAVIEFRADRQRTAAGASHWANLKKWQDSKACSSMAARVGGSTTLRRSSMHRNAPCT